MHDAGMDSLDGEVESVYRLLTDDDVSRGMRTETATRLEREGVDVDALRGRFVTYRAVRTFPKAVRGASYDAGTNGGVERARSSFERLVGRTTAVVERKLERLRASGALGSFRVRTTVTVSARAAGPSPT